MSDKAEVYWQVNGGYVGRARPQYTVIDIDDMVESCDTESEAEQYIDQCVQDDFEQRITPECSDISGVLETWRETKRTGEADQP